MAMFKKAEIYGISSITELGAGKYNAVYEVVADKRTNADFSDINHIYFKQTYKNQRSLSFHHNSSVSFSTLGNHALQNR